MDLEVLKRNIHKIKNTEKQISLNKSKKTQKIEQKWKRF